MIETYPYIVHTNRELELMLKGTKPLSVFCVDNIQGKEQFTIEMAQSNQDFNSHVEAGTFFMDRMKLTETRQSDGVVFVSDYYAYTLVGERWRAPAYFELTRMLKQKRWCQNLERFEGTLLGYTEEQNNYHINQKYPDSCSQKMNNG
ncbi:hypothetical protein [Ahrensia sp. 13_GOM-1096m]|uniref:hypothetical protein n=1 Tax=Ahrensia sp. 13_GOM-1096m TaxID=1380380 RepID=UPI00138AB9AF|nr:hypothetical protein [Ahrensia sp. 13_GOM-1096m]